MMVDIDPRRSAFAKPEFCNFCSNHDEIVHAVYRGN